MLDGQESAVEDRFFALARGRWHPCGNHRYRGEGVPYIKLNTGEVLYREEDVLAAERDGQRGFSWSRLKSALADCPEVDSKRLARRMERLREVLNNY